MHREGGGEQADTAVSGRADQLGRRVNDVQQGDVQAGFDLVGHAMHRVAADDEDIGAAPLQPASGIDHQVGGLIPEPGMLQVLDGLEVERPHQASRRMQATQPLANRLIDQAVILCRALPAQAAYQPDDGLLGHAQYRVVTFVSHVGDASTSAVSTLLS